MTERKRYCFETCSKEEAFAEAIGGMKRYWVRLDSMVEKYFERDAGEWPASIEFVRPVEECSSDTARLNWLDRIPYMAYRGFDYETGEVLDHHVFVDELRTPRLGIIKNTIREAIDAAMAGRFTP